MIYTWDNATIGDTAPPKSVAITDQQIADYCRAARYENLIYTNQPAARETGLPGIIAPPAMALAFAPPHLAGVAAAGGGTRPAGLSLNPVSITIRFQGAPVTHGDAITSVTRLTGKDEREGCRYLTFTVTAHNQEGQLAAEYEVEYLWEKLA
jgi:acyl dehydratase